MRPVRTTRDLGAAVRRRRLDLGLTQAELAERAQVSRPWLSNLEGGKRTAEIGKVLAVINALGRAVQLIEVPLGPVDLDALLDPGTEP